MKFLPKKSLGQNFLVNNEILNQIVNLGEIKSDDIVLEVGPGTGNLTDYLIKKNGSTNVGFSIRFHLHPNVRVIPIRNFGGALLKTRRGSGWQFAIEDGRVAIEDSVYIEGLSKPRRNKQIVFYGKFSSPEKTVKWQLKKI